MEFDNPVQSPPRKLMLIQYIMNNSPMRLVEAKRLSEVILDLKDIEFVTEEYVDSVLSALAK